MDSVAVIDLFAGAGGLGLGACQAGGDLRLSVEMDPICCQTLQSNHDAFQTSYGKVLQADITELSGQELRDISEISSNDTLMIVGGAPCQPFSKASYWTDSGEESRYRQARARGETVDKPTESPEARPDQRRTLVHEFWRIVSESRADAFIFENVPSILHPRNRYALENLSRTYARTI